MPEEIAGRAREGRGAVIRVLKHTPQGQPILVVGLTRQNVRLLPEAALFFDSRDEPPRGVGLEGGPCVLIICGKNDADLASILEKLEVKEA